MNILGVLPLIAAQHVDQCYGLDPSRFAIQTAMKTQAKYRIIQIDWLIDCCIYFLAHTQDTQFNVCTTRDEFRTILTKIEQTRKKNASLTCIFGPARSEVERQDLRQSIKSQFIFFEIIIFLIR
jgi:hypothetical protein